jgi:DNA replication and repair protein RecF
MHYEAPWTRLDATTPHGLRTVKLQAVGDAKAAKSFEIDSQVLTRLTQARTLPVVLFEPDHLLLLSGSPDLRRSFLDDLLEQMIPGYSATRRHYRRVLAHRNALLKRQPRDLADQLFVWNLRLSELGGVVVRERAALVARYGERLADMYSELADKTSAVTIGYTSEFAPQDYETLLLRKLEANTEIDIQRGFTTHGPHRDDLAILLGGQPASYTASRGEVRTLVLALKLLELQLLEELRGQKPLLLLDDVFSELDTQRRKALTRRVTGNQTFITTTDADEADNLPAHRLIKPA